MELNKNTELINLIVSMLSVKGDYSTLDFFNIVSILEYYDTKDEIYIKLLDKINEYEKSKQKAAKDKKEAKNKKYFKFPYQP